MGGLDDATEEKLNAVLWDYAGVGRDAERVVANATDLVEVRGDVDTVVAAATHVEDHGFTPFDTLHLVESDGDTIVTSDETYDGFAPRFDLKTIDDG